MAYQKKAKDPAVLTARKERIDRMVSMYKQGLTLEKIGQQYGITRERVRQIISKAGVTREEGGEGIKTAYKRKKKAASVHARYMEKYGQPPEIVKELRRARITHAYATQKKSASIRGIEWNLDFATWFSIWQTSGKLHLRGRGKGKYVMSRIKDDGAYELGNVHIQLATENSKEAVQKWKGKTKKNKGVFLLYPGRTMAWLSTYGKERLGFFETEELAVAARIQAMKSRGLDPVKQGSRGWTFIPRLKKKPYYMQAAGVKPQFFATAEEAEAAYRQVCIDRHAEKVAAFEKFISEVA